MAFIFLGVKTRDSSPRWTSWAGGSSNKMIPGGISMLALISSSTEPFPDRYDSQSTNAGSTSSHRLRAKKSYLSL